MIRLIRLLSLLGLMFSSALATAGDPVIESELNAYWSRVVKYLGEGDYEGVVSTYHPQAVLVSDTREASGPIARALARWKPGILATRAGREVSLVEFRMNRRYHDATTAHEQGIFHFRSGPADPDADDSEFAEAWVHFEALLIKDERWLMVMEYQKHEATLEEWEAATPVSPQFSKD